MVGSSSRGPQHESTTLIKPEIGAPGASVSAIAGSGTGQGPFGGTSGAAPMVAGAAALVFQAYGGTRAPSIGTPPGNAIGHGLSPLEVKSLLMNNGFTGVVNDPLTGALAPITRIGGGEVRVDRALAAPTAAWDKDVPSGALSFGFIDVADETVTLTKTVEIRNLDNKNRTYTVTPSFRFADDVANGDGDLWAVLGTAADVEGNDRAGVAWFILNSVGERGRRVGDDADAGHPGPGGREPCVSDARRDQVGPRGDRLHARQREPVPECGLRVDRRGRWRGRRGDDPRRAVAAGRLQRVRGLRPRWGDYGAAAVDGNTVYLAGQDTEQPPCTVDEFVATGGSCCGFRSTLANWSTRVTELIP